MSTKTLTGKEVLMIKATRVVREYSSETEGFKGKKYRIFASGDNAFAAHEEDEPAFFEGLRASGEGQIAEVEFSLNAEGQYSLNNWLTWGQLNSLKANEAKNQAITVEAFKPQSVKDYEQLA